ncbi:hypothetical protein [Chryseolinea lacunae]|uniref:Aerotolerance regulator N-terminal domain-containing protein n=1 Tax=Chryseolinea lacunae TaxID=2801331 RepID=A0ABS1KTV2_9BACT|nr:hypothetical protein [Chryseolinea lacunae]MBL0742885.1 hypothetical protein [Chryseolinea lacunae]
MKAMITFHALLSPLLIAGLLVPITILFGWLEWNRKHRFRGLRILAVVVLMTALALILLRPSTTEEKDASVLLLTPGYTSKQVDSLLQKQPNLQVWHTADAVPFKNSIALSSTHTLALHGDNIRFVIGNGLADYDLDLIKEKHFTYLPGQPIEGITTIAVSEPVRAHHLATVEGTYANIAGTKWIYLNGPGGKEDSLKVTGAGRHPFQLSFTPKQKGSLLYTVITKDSAGHATEDRLPVFVDEDRALTVLFIQNFPTFETQYLKRYLAHAGHKLTLRYQLSKQIFRFEYANRASQPVNKLTTEVLQQADLLILDRNAWQSLSTTEKAAVHNAVRAGLGWLTWPNAKEKVSQDFPFALAAVKTDTTQITLLQKAITLPALPYRVENQTGIQTSVKNKSGIVAAYAQVGRGKIGLQTLQETYRLSLSGDSLRYGALWSPLIEALARKSAGVTAVRIVTPFPWYADEPIAVQLLSAHPNPALLADSIGIPLQEDVQLDDVWSGKFWAGQPGWHTLQADDATPSLYYISTTGEWSGLRQATLRAQNMAASESHALQTEKVYVSREISPVYFFAMFVLAAAFLWMAPKL